MKDKYFKLHSSCIIVKGKSNGAIYDLRRGNLYNFPNPILELLEFYEEKGIELMQNDYKDQIDILNKYFDFLIKNELVFFTNNPKPFTKINETFRKPFLLDIVLIEIDNFDLQKKNFFKDDILSEIGCKELIIISSENSIENLKSILFNIEKSKVQTVTFFIDYKFYEKDVFLNLCTNNLRLREIIVYNVKDNLKPKEQHNTTFSYNSLENLLTTKINSVDDLVINLEAYIESKNYNLFYNRRIYIDNNNDIKHSIDEINNFGNLKNSNLTDIISSEKFTKLWKITKNLIEVCKDCELRYICPDNRIPLKRENEESYFHLLECNYNPYTNQWR